jgi:nitric oxide reductase large subunit
MFIGLQTVLVMLVFGLGFINLRDESEEGAKLKYGLGMFVAIGAWIVAAFVFG